MSSSNLAVSVRGLSKSYHITRNMPKHTTASEALMHLLKNPFRRQEREIFWALQDLNFDIHKGDVVGIIGSNGAGKSTLLKILSRITEPTTGQVDLYGRVGSLLEVGTGFHPELTGRENIYMNGAILGMSKREITRQFDTIVDFAEVEHFLETPVKRYSSGMYVRLAFAVAAHLNPEILVVDEVLAVGDAAFQRKCLGKMENVSQGGRTVLFVSHNTAAVSALCKSCLYLREGKVAAYGPTEQILQQYLSAQTAASGRDILDRTDRVGTGKMRSAAIAFFDLDNHPISTVSPKNSFFITVTFESYEDLKDVAVSIDVDTVEGIRVTTLYSGFQNQTFSVRKGTSKFQCLVESLPVRPDSYTLNILLGSEYEQHDLIRSACILEVEGSIYESGRVPDRIHGALTPRFGWTLLEEPLKLEGQV